MDIPALDNLSASGLFDITDHVALITEGCSRTGVIIATTLVDNGAKVYVASKDEVRLREGSQYRDSSWDLELASYLKSLLYVTGGLTELLAKAASASLPGRIINIPSNVLSESCEAQTEAEQVLSCKHRFNP
ncbi:hypothetical protein FRC11_008282 [Ceratobasidium sp. 423]|nr:hypothetical protein FRC11_008282 [Ceratobasidium sp. 423]